MQGIKEKAWCTDAGYRALAIETLRGPLNGYVGIPKGHLLYQVHYSDNVPELEPYREEVSGKASPEAILNAPGGVTYSGYLYTTSTTGLWWFGFDHAHSFTNCLRGCEALAQHLKEIQIYYEEDLLPLIREAQNAKHQGNNGQ